MNVEKCYEALGGDYAEVFSRLRTDERITKFLKLFPRDENFALLSRSLHDHHAEEAFRAAHTMKGICLNLSLTTLFKSVNGLTEALRGKTEISPDVYLIFEQVKNDYQNTVDAISAIDD